MTFVFRDRIGKTVYVYLDDIFVFSMTIEEHEEALAYVLSRLKDERLFIGKDKLDVYSDSMDCLGHQIDDQGLHADLSKMSRVRSWPTPESLQQVQSFLGLVQYIQRFIPGISELLTPLSSICANGRPFEWRPIHRKCFEEIKRRALIAPILRPINPALKLPIWLVTDASVSGVGAYYGQGESHHTMQPAGFMSRKFTDAQRSYTTRDHEMLAILEALLKWREKFIGYHVKVITDHEANEWFKSKPYSLGRHIRWQQFLDTFNLEIIWNNGKSNSVADALSRIFENRKATDPTPIWDYVDADYRLDANGDDLPMNRKEEVAKQKTEVQRNPRLLVLSTEKSRLSQTTSAVKDAPDARADEAEQLKMHKSLTEEPNISYPHVRTSGNHEINDTDPMVKDSINISDKGPQLETLHGFREAMVSGYKDDVFFQKVLAKLKEYPSYKLVGDLLYLKSSMGDRLCIPDSLFEGRRIRERFIDHVHSLIGHAGDLKTIQYLRRFYYWPSLGINVAKFVHSCAICQTAKALDTQKPMGLLHGLPIPTRPWQSIAMDFLGPFPASQGFDLLWVVLCRLTSLVHLIPITVNFTASDLAYSFLREVVRLHGVPESIVSDRDRLFTSVFWKELHRQMGVKLLMSTAFHPQTDGQSEVKIKAVGKVLRTSVDADQRNWVAQLPMVEFALNSTVSSSTTIAPFEAAIGFLPNSIPVVPHSVFDGVTQFLEQAKLNIAIAHDALIGARTLQAYHANKRRRSEGKALPNGDEDPYINLGSLVYLSTENISFPKGLARKLLPKFIGPYRVKSLHHDTSTYTLELPEELKKRRIHPTFHVSLLRPHHPSDDNLFPNRQNVFTYEFTAQKEAGELFVQEITGHRFVGKTNKRLELLVHWEDGDSTWEPYSKISELAAIDTYCQLFGVKDVKALPKAGHMPSSTS